MAMQSQGLLSEEGPYLRPKPHHFQLHTTAYLGHEAVLELLGVSTVEQAIVTLHALKPAKLREIFRKVYESPTRSQNKNWLQRRIVEVLGVKPAEYFPLNTGGKPRSNRPVKTTVATPIKTTKPKKVSTKINKTRNKGNSNKKKKLNQHQRTSSTRAKIAAAVGRSPVKKAQFSGLKDTELEYDLEENDFLSDADEGEDLIVESLSDVETVSLPDQAMDFSLSQAELDELVHDEMMYPASPAGASTDSFMAYNPSSTNTANINSIGNINTVSMNCTDGSPKHSTAQYLPAATIMNTNTHSKGALPPPPLSFPSKTPLIASLAAAVKLGIQGTPILMGRVIEEHPSSSSSSLPSSPSKPSISGRGDGDQGYENRHTQDNTKRYTLRHGKQVQSTNHAKHGMELNNLEHAERVGSNAHPLLEALSFEDVQHIQLAAAAAAVAASVVDVDQAATNQTPLNNNTNNTTGVGLDGIDWQNEEVQAMFQLQVALERLQAARVQRQQQHQHQVLQHRVDDKGPQAHPQQVQPEVPLQYGIGALMSVNSNPLWPINNVSTAAAGGAGGGNLPSSLPFPPPVRFGPLASLPSFGGLPALDSFPLDWLKGDDGVNIRGGSGLPDIDLELFP